MVNVYEIRKETLALRTNWFAGSILIGGGLKRATVV